MALDFGQVDSRGDVIGLNVRVTIEMHAALFESVSGKNFPLLARLHDYYEDVAYGRELLVPLAAELREYASVVGAADQRALLNDMAALVDDSIEKELLVEAIAD